jgi:hypothetical protein
MPMLRKYQVRDRHGNLVDRDDDVPLRDGERLRVPLYMMDSLQRAVVAHARETSTDRLTRDARRRKDESDDRKDAAVMITDDATYITDRNTGGCFVLADALGRTDRASLARDNGFRFLVPADDRAEGAMAVQRMERARAYREMCDAQASAWRGDAAPPSDAPPTFDAVEGARRKREAYDAMCHDMANAWKSRK